MLYWHRWASLLAGIVILYIAATGLWMQSLDLWAQVTHAPTSNPTIQEFRQHLNGADNYAVISDPDYTERALPTALDASTTLSQVAQMARKADPKSPMRLIELRMTGDTVTGHVAMGKQHMLFDAKTGARLPDSLLPPKNPNAINEGIRPQIKSWHKFAFNKVMLQKASTINLLAGIAVFVLMVTGLTQYVRLLKVRRKIGKPQLFWKAGGTWRRLHRWTAVVFAVVIVWLTVTGMLMAVSDIGAAWAEWKSPRDQRPMNPDKSDYSTPIKDAEIPGMAHATLVAFDRDYPGVPMRVLRLRYFAGYAQGAVVTGEEHPVQHVFNTKTGSEMGVTEPGYPITNFPFGWQWHQTVKKLHRGDYFGLTGNWIEWLGGVALLYFSVSGLWMYWEMWRKRAKSGRTDLVWK